jgi:hypothetical protein
MRRFAGIALSALLVVTLAVGWASASGRGVTREESLTLFSETQVFKSIDAGKPGFSIGDQDLVIDHVFSDSAKTDLVGKDRVVQEYLPHNYALVQVEYTIEGRGDIFLAGTLDFGPNFVKYGDDLPIVGGTGDFEGAGGSAHLSVFDDETFEADMHIIP